MAEHPNVSYTLMGEQILVQCPSSIMANVVEGIKNGIVVWVAAEDSELRIPHDRLTEEGIAVDVASTRRGRIHGTHGYEIEVDTLLTDVSLHAYDLLTLAGGKAPAILRKDGEAIRIAIKVLRAQPAYRGTVS